MKMTFFDVDYANIKNKSICQIGILSRDFNKSDDVTQINLLINPEDCFDMNCINIHGLRDVDTVDAPNFKTIWPDIKKYFTNAIIVGHNVAASDLDALQKNLTRYNIEVPEIYYICTYELSKKIIPPFAVADYGLETLCNHFNISFSKHHNALHNACACFVLLERLIKCSRINIENEIGLYIPYDMSDYVTYITDSTLKKDIHDFYGMVKGFALDSHINEEEKDYIRKWRESFADYHQYSDIARIIEVVDTILEDDYISKRELDLLQSTIRQYLDMSSTSMITLATQVLNGILRGMVIDDIVTEDECISLRNWLYQNNYLASYHPFDKLFDLVESILKDGVLTKNESDEFKDLIGKILNPLKDMKREISSIKGQHVCLSGDFSTGKKSTIEKYISDNGGVVDSTVESTTDIVVIGNEKRTATLFDTYDKKIERALEYKKQGRSIQILKEFDVIEPSASFCQVLTDFIDEKGYTDAEVYKKAQLTRQMMSKIRCEPNYKPSKQNICAFAIALRLNVSETNELLASAGYTLSRSLAFDRVLADSISHGNYDIFDINEKLSERGINWLGIE